MRKLLLPLLLLALATAPATAADYDGGELIVQGELPVGNAGVFETSALTPAYSNIASFLGSAYAPAGAALQAGNTITRLVADDITPLPLYGGLDVVQFTFAVANLNAVSVSFRPRVRFWFANGAAGAPGTYYNVPAAVGFTFNPVTVAATTVTLLTASVNPGTFTMPGVPFWAGITFDNNVGGTGATATQMNNIGAGLFSPPTVGSSTDQLFQTTAAGSHFAPNNPAGSTFNFSGNPVANLGWEFVVDNATPTTTSSWGRVKALYR